MVRRSEVGQAARLGAGTRVPPCGDGAHWDAPPGRGMLTAMMRRLRDDRDGQAGFGLVDVAVAIGLLRVLCTALAQQMATGIKATMDATIRQQASSLASKQVEDARTAGFD